MAETTGKRVINMINKTSKQLERHFKGVANHRRLDILFLVEKNSGIDLSGIADELDANVKTISDHTRRLTHAGLIMKSYVGTQVVHSLSPYGRKFIEFIKSFRNS